MSAPDATLILKRPVSLGNGEPVHTLYFRRPKARDFQNMPKTGEDIALLARITNQPRSIIEELDGADYIAAGEIVKDFLGLSPGTGEASSDGSPTE